MQEGQEIQERPYGATDEACQPNFQASLLASCRRQPAPNRLQSAESAVPCDAQEIQEVHEIQERPYGATDKASQPNFQASKLPSFPSCVPRAVARP